MGKEGNYSAGAKVYESKKEKKRRLLMNSVSESEELVIAPSEEIGRSNIVLGKWDGGEKRVTRSEVLRSKLGSVGSKGKVRESREDSKSRGVGADQPDCEDINLESGNSAENQTDTTGVVTDSLTSLNLRHNITGIAKEDVTESKSERKRSMETCDNELINRKKAKTDHLDYGDDQTEKFGGDNNLAIGEHADKDMGSVNGDAEVSKLSVSWANERDGEGSSESNLHPGTGTTGKSCIKIRGKNVVGVLPSKKKVTVTGDAIIPCEEQGNRRRLRSSSMNKSSTSNNLSVRQVGKKSNSNIKNRKGAGKISSEDIDKSSFSKKKLKSLSPKEDSKGVELLHSKSFLAEKNGEKLKESNISRSTAKNNIRDQIKNILLDAGWKVEYRPRRERDYLDSVYVSPQGSGYWSITKAYDIYLRQFQSASDVKEGSEMQSKAKKAVSTVAVIPPEILLMLKRKVVNKRRRKEEIEEERYKKGTYGAKRKVGIGRRKKKIKEVTKVKRSKDKGTRDDIGGTRSMKRKLVVKNSKKRGRALLVRGSNQDDGSENGDYTPYAWKRTVLSWLIDLGLLQAYGKVSYMNKRRTRALLDGRITRDGIECSCCSKILTVSKFEIHAGSKLHQPYENVCLDVSGISLLQCQINAWERESKLCIFYDVNTDGDDPNDDTCAICGDGGDLICCDSCPSTFHLGCLGIEMLPTGDWHCTNCSCKFCRSVHDSTSQDGDATYELFTCSQCAQKYHKNCVPEGDAVSNFHNSSSNMFCGRSCRKVFRKLQKLIGVRNKLETGIFWSIVRRFDDPSKFPSRMAQRVESNSKTAVAYAVMDECFVPIIDQRSGINLIHNVVYNCGANFNRLNFSDFYTFILERGDEIVAAASVRIHDTRMAEMPFIGTRSMYRRQGMCRRLLKGIESALRSLCIDKLIIPAISELTETWTTVFGFKPLEISQMQEVKSVNMLVFPGTGLLQKSLKRVSNKQHTNPELENKPETQISVKAAQNCSADEFIDVKESKCVAEAIKPDIPVSEHTNNLLPEASGCCAQICISLDCVENADSNEIQNANFCSNHIDKDISPRNCSNEMVAFIEEIKKEGEDVKNDFLSFQHPSSEFLLGATEIEISQSRSPQIETNFELPVTDVSKNCNYEKKDESTLVFLQKPKDKPPSNGVAPDFSLEKCELMEEAQDRAHDINEVNLMHDYNGLESNVNEESVDVSTDVIKHLTTSPGKGTYTSSEVCENSCGANTELCSVASDESSQEKSELLQNQLKCYIGANDLALPEQLAVNGSAKNLDVESVSGIV